MRQVSLSLKACLPLLLLPVVLTLSCSTVPVTGRSQLQLLSSDSLNTMSFQNYREFLTEHPLSFNAVEADRVRRVGRRIEEAVESHFRSAGSPHQLSGYQWDFSLVEDKAANAFCMPGGKVVVYAGMLPVADTDAKLAVVMSHEIAHAVANHGNERMSQAMLAQFGGMALAQALKERPADTQRLFMNAFGIGSQVGVLLPFSRIQELEADRLGLIFMAAAGYDPNAAVEFWQQMAAQKQSQPLTDFLSTHPSDPRRIQQLQQLIPEAMRYYRPQFG